jgi:hypothetical protein
MRLKLFILFQIAVLSAMAQTTYVSSDFKGTTAADWTMVTGMGAGPSLTAATGVDPDGQGWMRLTKDDYNQSSFVYHNTALPTSGGLQFMFDFVIWGAGSTRADGLTLAIFDAVVTPSAGAYGGSLGYAQRTGINGLAGGIVGFGFDTFGNFSNPNEGRIGGVGSRPNSIAVRGSMGATRMDGYQYITGVTNLDAFSSQTTNRDDAVVHTVRITIPTNKELSIEWKAEGVEEWTTLIDKYLCDLICPDEVKFGFTAGTGSVKSNQEIRNLSVTSIPEPASVLMMSTVLAAGFWIRRRFVE